jgi:hypothetical protein
VLVPERVDRFDRGIRGILSGLLVATAALPASAQTETVWRGNVRIEGMIREPGGYHPYVTTVILRLREGGRASVPGGVRTPLISDGSVMDVRTGVYEDTGQRVCVGTGTEELPGRRLGHLETKQGRTSYHLVIPRAFGAFACGTNNVIERDRRVIIGLGDPETGEIETADSVPRVLEQGGSVMRGAFRSATHRNGNDYEYVVSWSASREAVSR